jgi:nitrite reductase/ring-hydroxylating ferredoxin subunit
MATAVEKLGPSRVVDNRVYHDQRTFDLEVENIFYRSWLFVAHESEIANSGDFVTTTLFGNPLIINRDRDNQIHAFLNVCRHRGSVIVDEPKGHCSAFRCPYHFWVYSLTGELAGVSQEAAYDGTGFEKGNYPLIEVDCAVELGLVFVHLSKDHGTLREWLGADLIAALSTPLALADFDVVHSDPSQTLPINWKVFAENVRDGYHVPFVHPFLRKSSPPGPYRLLDNGHAIQQLGADPAGFDAADWEYVARHPFPGLKVGDGWVLNLFPNTMLQMRWNMLSIDFIRALSPTQSVLENRTLGLASDTAEVREVRRKNRDYWIANPLEDEDIPVFYKQQAGVSAPLLRFSVIARGADATEGTRGDDNRLRQFWTVWREMMGVEQNSTEAG